MQTFLGLVYNIYRKDIFFSIQILYQKDTDGWIDTYRHEYIYSILYMHTVHTVHIIFIRYAGRSLHN